MIDKMIDALDTHDCQKVIEAIKNNFFFWVYSENATPDPSRDLYNTYCELHNAVKHLEYFHNLRFVSKYHLDISDRLVLGDADMSSLEKAQYLCKIYPKISSEDAKIRVKIFVETGK